MFYPEHPPVIWAFLIPTPLRWLENRSQPVVPPHAHHIFVDFRGIMWGHISPESPEPGTQIGNDSVVKKRQTNPPAVMTLSLLHLQPITNPASFIIHWTSTKWQHGWCLTDATSGERTHLAQSVSPLIRHPSSYGPQLWLYMNELIPYAYIRRAENATSGFHPADGEARHWFCGVVVLRYSWTWKIT